MTNLATRAGPNGSFMSEHERMASENDFINVFEASALLGVHDQTLRKLARQKKVPAFKVGKEWRFRREALVRWADEQGQVETGDHTCSVLIIDDEEKICAALARMVERLGWRARQATNGKTGLEMVDRDDPDVILLDLKMPNMNGPQFLAELRKVHRKLPVIIVTGYPDGELMQQASQYPPVMLLAKPVEPEHLERTVRSVVGAKSVIVNRRGAG